jgi:hypothetical protein
MPEFRFRYTRHSGLAHFSQGFTTQLGEDPFKKKEVLLKRLKGVYTPHSMLIFRTLGGYSRWHKIFDPSPLQRRNERKQHAQAHLQL